MGARPGWMPCERCGAPGGEGGIRTLEWFPITPLAGARLQPLGHLSAGHGTYDFARRFPTPKRTPVATAPRGVRGADGLLLSIRLSIRLSTLPGLLRRPPSQAGSPFLAGARGGGPAWRRGWDSNPRELSLWRFSRPLPSTARPPLRAEPFLAKILGRENRRRQNHSPKNTDAQTRLPPQPGGFAAHGASGSGAENTRPWREEQRRQGPARREACRDR